MIINKEGEVNSMFVNKTVNKPVEYKVKIVWRNVILMILLHVGAVYGYILGLYHGKWQGWIFLHIIANCSSLGVQAGAHRLWSHRSYKAILPLRIILAFFQTLALQNDIYEWCRDHRVHHKYTETDADPHNAKRGFFFSHVGWLMCKKHPDVITKGKTIDLSDLMADPVVRFQRKYYVPLVLLIWGVIPTYIPVLLWGESAWTAFFSAVLFRYVYTLNLTWCVNSAAHMWGKRPYDKGIEARECSMRHLLMGEGFHNYHHSFPWDYSASELGPSHVFNPATAFIDFCAAIGWAYDLRVAPDQVIQNKMMICADQQEGIKRGKSDAFNEWFFGLLSMHWLLIISLVVKVFIIS